MQRNKLVKHVQQVNCLPPSIYKVGQKGRTFSGGAGSAGGDSQQEENNRGRCVLVKSKQSLKVDLVPLVEQGLLLGGHDQQGCTKTATGGRRKLKWFLSEIAIKS